ncbi:uncharacterized protein LOC125491763 [Beta vulgaris subsp. vulgaris]|uniref:uncharacterized protein LOC125491763 n=1 Tax=Beta vulgaris subsp. vulgaris TaxID=3555 RepID=UPI00254867AD|nr:uncharacterized protein LOC125491763 [Beta vulgaris subsp. vulgaris]
MTKCFKQHFHHPWRNYSQVDDDTKNLWFSIFKGSYKWREELQSQVRSTYDRKMAKRLKDNHHSIVKKKGGVCPTWLSLSIHEQMMKNAQDKDFKARSQKASKNRRGGDLTSSVPPSHVQGSISSAERAKRLAAQRGGMLPSVVDLFMDTHMRDESGKKVPINDKVQKIKISVLNLLRIIQLSSRKFKGT